MHAPHDQKYIGLINRAAKMLEYHTSDILDQTMLKNGHFTLNPSQGNLMRIIKDTIDLVKPQAKLKDL